MRRAINVSIADSTPALWEGVQVRAFAASVSLLVGTAVSNGDCALDATLQALGRRHDAAAVRRLRLELAEFLRQHLVWYAAHSPSKDGELRAFDQERIDRLAASNEYLDRPELAALAALLETTIIVINKRGSVDVLDSTLAPANSNPLDVASLNAHASVALLAHTEAPRHFAPLRFAGEALMSLVPRYL